MQDLFRLDDRIAVVVGGGGGIGRHLAKGLACYGAKVVIASRNLEALKGIAKELQAETGSEVVACQVDVTNEESVAKLKNEVVSSFGKVDILVNSQGYNAKSPATEFPEKEWNMLFDINVKGIMLTCREFGKVMIERRKGKVINVSSVRGARVTKWPGNLGYCTTKSAVDMLTKALAAEWAPYNVNVNAIAPAIVDTGFAPTFKDPQRLKLYLESIPLGRIEKPEDIIGTCIFLASPASDYITGQIIYVDGGLTVIG